MNATAPTPVTARRALATPADYERVGVCPLSPGLAYRAKLASLDEDTRNDLAVVVSRPSGLARTMLTHRRLAAMFQRSHQAGLRLDTAATAPAWDGAE